MTDIRTEYTEGLYALVDLLNNNPDLPLPFVYGSGPLSASWYLHINGMDLIEQKAAAASIVTTLGGKWDKAQWDERFDFNQDRDGLKLGIVVARDAVCERVVTGTHEVIVPATAATAAVPGHVETVEDVKWVCGSLLVDDADGAE